MRKHHFHLQYFSFYDLDGMGRHLEEMAARGWMLEKMTTSAGITGVWNRNGCGLR